MSQKNKKSQGILGLIVGLLMAVLVVAMAPTAIVVMVGLLPTFVAVFLDPSRERMAGVAIGALNFAGTLPALLQLWRGENTMGSAVNLITNPYMLLLMYAGAAIGWVIYWQLPPLIGQMVRGKAELHLKKLDEKQLDLITEWGPPVAGGLQKEDL